MVFDTRIADADAITAVIILQEIEGREETNGLRMTQYFSANRKSTRTRTHLYLPRAADIRSSTPYDILESDHEMFEMQSALNSSNPGQLWVYQLLNRPELDLPHGLMTVLVSRSPVSDQMLTCFFELQQNASPYVKSPSCLRSPITPSADGSESLSRKKSTSPPSGCRESANAPPLPPSPLVSTMTSTGRADPVTSPGVSSLIVSEHRQERLLSVNKGYTAFAEKRASNIVTNFDAEMFAEISQVALLKKLLKFIEYKLREYIWQLAIMNMAFVMSNRVNGCSPPSSTASFSEAPSSTCDLPKAKSPPTVKTRPEPPVRRTPEFSSPPLPSASSHKLNPLEVDTSPRTSIDLEKSPSLSSEDDEKVIGSPSPPPPPPQMQLHYPYPGMQGNTHHPPVRGPARSAAFGGGSSPFGSSSVPLSNSPIIPPSASHFSPTRPSLRSPTNTPHHFPYTQPHRVIPSSGGLRLNSGGGSGVKKPSSSLLSQQQGRAISITTTTTAPHGFPSRPSGGPSGPRVAVAGRTAATGSGNMYINGK
ncbi:hypothetical protein ACTXT7_002483 [Hymenolepis weldensis]